MSGLRDTDRRHVWHPFTQHGTERDFPVITHAKGACLYDDQGCEILDLISSWWTCTHGHSHPALNAALAAQAEKAPHVMFAGFTHEPAVRLAERLAQTLPGGLSRVFFSDNGSTAVEVALKVALQYWKNKGQERARFLAFEGAYHGDTVGAMSAGKSCGFFGAYEDFLFSVDTVPFAFTWEGDEGIEAREAQALAALDRALGKDVAALIVEPLMQGAGGIRFCRPEFMRAVTERARAAGALVIYDEVAVGFGRSGTLFACERIGVSPDLICLSKGLTGGYMPMSVTVAREDIFEAFLGEGFGKALAHGHSFTANPLACAVALKSLELFTEENTLEKIAAMEARHREFLPALQTHPGVARARVLGSVLAFNLAEESGYKSAGSEFLKRWYLSRGLNIRPIGGAVYMMPPYCTSAEQLGRAYDGLLEGLSQLQRRAA